MRPGTSTVDNQSTCHNNHCIRFFLRQGKNVTNTMNNDTILKKYILSNNEMNMNIKNIKQSNVY